MQNKERQAPMFQFALEAAELRDNMKAPQLDSLLQLPPTQAYLSAYQLP